MFVDQPLGLLNTLLISQLIGPSKRLHLEHLWVLADWHCCHLHESARVSLVMGGATRDRSYLIGLLRRVSLKQCTTMIKPLMGEGSFNSERPLRVNGPHHTILRHFLTVGGRCFTVSWVLPLKVGRPGALKYDTALFSLFSLNLILFIYFCGLWTSDQVC